MEKIDKLKAAIIQLDELEKLYSISSYKELFNKVNDLIEAGKLSPVKSSGGNGKNPTLFKKYRIIKVKDDNNQLIDEIFYKLSTRFNVEYYKNHLDKYKEHRAAILKLNDFFLNNQELLSVRVSMNERAFQIWGREKFLQKENGKTIVKNLGLELGNLNYYDTSEPLAYYSKSKKAPQKILILENKDTYYTMRRHLIAGGEAILGEEIGTIIYGKGKNINKAFSDFKISVEDYVCDSRNTILYFGDLDYEGIIIYEGLYKMFGEEYKVSPFINGYKKLIDKINYAHKDLPSTKEGQNRNIQDIFLREFHKEYVEKIKNILEADLYIPQEALNITDL